MSIFWYTSVMFVVLHCGCKLFSGKGGLWFERKIILLVSNRTLMVMQQVVLQLQGSWFEPEFGYLSVHSFVCSSCVHVGFSPLPQQNTGVFTGSVKSPLGVSVCVNGSILSMCFPDTQCPDHDEVLIVDKRMNKHF